ncbi:hypothetical protein JCM10908_007345 [Rhodotorula pacifica]|uniref:uncharacterized protein n=1 Tax=Rhodotorula pacifica TaxID=1495444 RepID=UPI00317688CF
MEEQSVDASPARTWAGIQPLATPSSDAGEIEEARAALLGERYWTQIPTPAYGSRSRFWSATEPGRADSSEDELAMSPIRPQTRTATEPSSATPRRKGPSPSLRQPTFAHRVRSPARSARNSSPADESLPHPDELLKHQKQPRVPSPARSDKSDDVLDLVARKPRPVDPAALSPLSSPSPSPARAPSPSPAVASNKLLSPIRSSPRPRQPSPDIPPDPDPPFPGGVRALRTRKPAQLRPYSLDQAKYQIRLEKNGWEGAVVPLDRGSAAKETPEELRRRKEMQALRPKNHLGGWLVSDDEYEDESEKRARDASGGMTSSQPTSSNVGESLESEDGLTLLERETRKKERLEKAVSVGMGGHGSKRNYSPHRYGPSRLDEGRPTTLRVPKRAQQNSNGPSRKRTARSDSSGSETERGTSKTRHRRVRAESAPASASPASSPQKRKRNGSANGGKQPRRAEGSSAGGASRRKASSSVRRIRADSEPLTSSPQRENESRENGKRRAGKPTKSIRNRKRTQSRFALEQDILNHPLLHLSSENEGDEESDDSVHFRSDGESDQPSTDDNEPDEYALRPEDLGPARLKLGGKRKRFLGAMMPGAFIKKAEQDLKLMAQEIQLPEYSDGSEINSGDEEALQRAQQRNLAKKRKAPRLLDDPLRFDADAFTDESGTDSNRSDDGLDAAQDEEAENDAVASWLHSFAPQRAQGGNEDIVDRFLKRAKRPPKLTRSKKRKTSAVHPKRQGSREPAHKKQKRRKASGPAADGVFVVEGSRVLDGAGSPRRRPRAIPLDTDEAIFSCAGLRDESHDADDVEVAIEPSAHQHGRGTTADIAARMADIPPLPADSAAAGEVWASFGKFSYDFDFQRLPSGLRVDRPESFVSNGHLLSLVRKATAPSVSGPCDVFGLALASEDDAHTFIALLPTVVDGIHAALRAVALDEVQADGESSMLRSLQFVGKWLDSRQSATEIGNVAKALTFHLDRLDARLEDVHDSPATSKRYRLARLELAWYRLDLALRSGREGLGTASDGIRSQVTHIVRLLIRHGLERTVKTLKVASREKSTIADASVEIWLGLIALATHEGSWTAAGLDSNGLWEIVLEQTETSLSEQARRGPVRGEVLSYTAVLLSAVSQITPAGMSTATPRLPAHWPVMLKTLDTISPTALAKSDNSLSSTAVSRRDKYLWTLFARCLNLVERWNWAIDVKDDLPNRLFDLLSARKLADLTTETSGDFPAFLQDIAEFDHLRLDPVQDTAFVIFLKLVISACRRLPANTDAEKRKRDAQLTRLSVRLTPMVSSSWNRHSPELARGSSILTNSMSLHLALAVLHPPAAVQRLNHARRLAVFAEIDEESRRTCIRAALYFGLAFRHCELSVTPATQWLADIVTVLKTEYIEVERARRQAPRREDSRASGQGDALWQRAVLLTMALRSIQLITRWKKPGASRPDFPDLALLSASWTSNLLDTALALDPMIGRETIKTIECFLDVRHAAMTAPALATAAAVINNDGNGESQDDYGGLDFDFDDPALNALLGGEENAADPKAELRAKDKASAELLKSTIIPAFFRLVSNVLADTSTSGPTVSDRTTYAQYAVSAWARCLAVAVENGVTDWAPYLQYGQQSWKRLSDPIRRREIGLFLVTEMIKHDPATQTVFAADILEIWFESMVARRLSAQHTLTTAMLNAETPTPLLADLPFSRDTSTGRYDVEQLDLLDKRLEVLAVVFANGARFAANNTNLQQPPSTAQLLHRPGAAPIRPTVTRMQVMNLLRGMLASMRDNLGAIQDENNRSAYAAFVRSVLTALVAAGSTAPGPGGQAGKRGPFDEISLPDIRILRTAIA